MLDILKVQCLHNENIMMQSRMLDSSLFLGKQNWDAGSYWCQPG